MAKKNNGLSPSDIAALIEAGAWFWQRINQHDIFCNCSACNAINGAAVATVLWKIEEAFF